MYDAFRRHPDMIMSLTGGVIRSKTGIAPKIEMRNKACTFDCYEKESDSATRVPVLDAAYASLATVNDEASAAAVLQAMSMHDAKQHSDNPVSAVTADLAADAPIGVKVFSVSRESADPDVCDALGQHNTYSVCSWVPQEEVVGSICGWIKSIERDRKPALEHHLDVTLPAFIEHKWGEVVR